MDQEVEDLLDSEVNKIYGRCRCCLDLGYVKNMWTKYSSEGAHEIYGEMLMETFSIAWDSPLNGKEQICNACVTRLRDAHMFKREVLASEQLLKEGVLDSESESIKEERLSDLDQYEHTTEAVIEDSECKEEDEEEVEAPFEEECLTDENVEYEEVEYLEEEMGPETKSEANDPEPDSDEPEPQTKSVSRPKRKRTHGLNTRNYRNYSEDTLRQSIEAALNTDRSISEVAALYGVPRKTLTAKVYNAKHGPKPDDPGISSDGKPSWIEEDPPRKNSNANKKRINVKTILTWSNATPFKNRGSEYACCFCEKYFSSSKELKHHTLTHTDECCENRIKTLCENTVRIDITDLNCVVCDKNIDSLKDLINHLINHGKIYYTDIKNYIIPYKFDSDKFKCTQCGLYFKFFKTLSDHMSEHYRNYQCDQCSKAFVSQKLLASHRKRHILGEFKCSACPKTFMTKERCFSHQRVVHVYSSKAVKCWKCNLYFLNADKKAEHDEETHGVEPVTYECNMCERTFKSRRSEIRHVNNYHLKRKPHNCKECGMTFANKTRLERHKKVKHTRPTKKRTKLRK